jgi:hypothetical protein
VTRPNPFRAPKVVAAQPSMTGAPASRWAP